MCSRSLAVLCGLVVAAGSHDTSAQAPCRNAKVFADDGSFNDQLGRSVAVFGDLALVGAPGTDSVVYLYRRVQDEWRLETRLEPDDGAAGTFGFSVSLSEDTAVVGAPNDDDHGESSGSAYVFRNVDDVWTQETKLTADDGAPRDLFGVSVSLSGETLLIGAQSDDDHGNQSGSAYIFERDRDRWAQASKLLAPDGEAGDAFGLSVSLSGDLALVGAVGDDDNGDLAGSAYVVRREGAEWVVEAKLLPDDGREDDHFAMSVSISGEVALIGAHRDDDRGTDSGSAYVFRRTGEAWLQEAKLVPDDGTFFDGFGIAVSLFDNTALIGAFADDDHGSASGSAYAFQGVGFGGWKQLGKMLPDEGEKEARFGRAVGLHEETAMVGAPFEDEVSRDSGAAYVFSIRGCELCPEGAKLRAKYKGAGTGDRDQVIVRLSGYAPKSEYFLQLLDRNGQPVGERVATTNSVGRGATRFRRVECTGATHRVHNSTCDQQRRVKRSCGR